MFDSRAGISHAADDMKKASIQMIDAAASVMNRHLMEDTPVGGLLRTQDSNHLVVLVNEILREAAEGGSLVAAVESDGTLLGFVPRASVPIPDRPVDPKPPASPDEGRL